MNSSSDQHRNPTTITTKSVVVVVVVVQTWNQTSVRINQTTIFRLMVRNECHFEIGIYGNFNTNIDPVEFKSSPALLKPEFVFNCVSISWWKDVNTHSFSISSLKKCSRLNPPNIILSHTASWWTCGDTHL